MADSSTEAMPSMTVPSPGIRSPASTTTTSPRSSSAAGFSDPSRSRAVVCLRIARRASACALPRPSAIASARLPKITVSQSHIATVSANQPGWPVSPTIHMSVVNRAPISTTNMTGLRTMSRGSSFRSACTSVPREIIAAPPGRARG